MNPALNASDATACLFLRLEGPLQSWGGRTIGRFRRTESVPQKSAVLGLLGAALGRSRRQFNERLDELNRLAMTVRVDRAGSMLEDYQTIGAKIGVLAANGEIKKTAATGEFEAIISPREYLIDASFLVILQGEDSLIRKLGDAVRNPHWPLFLGRKRCVPGAPMCAGVASSLTLADAIQRDGPDDQSLLPSDDSPTVRVVSELLDSASFQQLAVLDDQPVTEAYEHARSYLTDRPAHLDPPVHAGRIVLDFPMLRPEPTAERAKLKDGLFGIRGPREILQRASDPKAKKRARDKAHGRCIFCRFEPSDPRNLHAHHLTYVRRGRESVTEDLTETTDDDDFVMLCKECHDAVSMLEYQNGFGLHRIDPRRPEWRSRILAAREERRRYANPAAPVMSRVAEPVTTANVEESPLLESVIPLRAGTSFDEDSPGNRWLGNRHHVHQRLSMAFPEPGGRFAANGYGVTRDEGGFQFRIEENQPVARLIVRSRILPDWGRAFGDAGWLFDDTIPPPQLCDTSSITVDSEWRFRLVANPTVKRKVPGKKNGRRDPCVTEEQQIAWLLRKAEAGGFRIGTLENDADEEVPNVRVVPVGRLKSFRKKDKRTLCHHGVRFDGVLQVTEPERFIETLETGIGSAKAFGFGLLSIAPM